MSAVPAGTVPASTGTGPASAGPAPSGAPDPLVPPLDPAWSSIDRQEVVADVLDVAPWLLNKLLVRGGRAGRIVEVEAYRGPDDPASHAFRGPTARNATMYGPPGHLYVYFTYGMHWCANLVCGPSGTPQGALIRALAPVSGIEAMRAVRPAARRDRDLCSGPAKLCQALGITGEDDGTDVVHGDRGILVVDDGVVPPEHPGNGVRVGVAAAAELAWRWWVEGDPNVSRRDRPL